MTCRLLAGALLLASLAYSGSHPSLDQSAVTVFLDFDQPASEVSIKQMEQHVERLLSPAGLRVDWRSLPDNRGTETFAHVVVLHFRGKCQAGSLIDEQPRSADQALTLGLAQVSNGKILPFGEVHCDEVRRLLGSGKPDESQLRDWDYGRALGYVTAHELYHILTGKSAHDPEGVSKATQTSKDLTSRTLEFASQALKALTEVLQRAMAAKNPSSAAFALNDAKKLE